MMFSSIGQQGTATAEIAGNVTQTARVTAKATITVVTTSSMKRFPAFNVVRGLDPRIHALRRSAAHLAQDACCEDGWMRGASPRMTCVDGGGAARAV